MSDEPEDVSESDEVNREDRLERYWFFFNGEWAETIFGLAAGVGGVFWCFLYLLGFSRTIIGDVLAGVAIAGFLGWYLFLRTIRRYERSGWRKRPGNSSADKRKVYVAIGLWSFIVLFFGALILSHR
jgi:hypothetical protein